MAHDSSEENDKPRSNPVLTKDGGLRALNYVLDVAKGRKTCVTFIFDEESGHIKAVSDRHTKLIEVRYTTSRS